MKCPKCQTENREGLLFLPGEFYLNILSPLRDCVAMGEMVENVMLNLFQHLKESISYETLKRVQGDKK